MDTDTTKKYHLKDIGRRRRPSVEKEGESHMDEGWEKKSLIAQRHG